MRAGADPTSAGGAARGWPREAVALAALGIGLLALYLATFNHDFTVDGLRYAAQVEQGGPLFHPNHLLPNALFWLAWRAAQALGAEGVRAAWVAQGVNVVAGVGTALGLCRALAERAGLPAACALALLYAAGFAAWTFAEEPEVYVLPACAVAWSLALLWRVPRVGPGRLAAVAALAVFAVLCLQQYVFWFPLLLALLARQDLGPARRMKWWAVALGVPSACLAAYVLLGLREGQLADLPHTLGWFLGYAWDGQHGLATYRAAPATGARLAGLLLGLGNLAFAYEVVLSVPALAAALLAGAGLLVLAGRAGRAWRAAAPYHRDARLIAAWMSTNLLFAFWWESRDIEFLLPLWLGGILLVGLSRAPWQGLLPLALLLGGINLACAFAPQRDWPWRYRTALALADAVPLRAGDVLITDELNTVAWLDYFHHRPVRFLPGAVSAAMHADQSVAAARGNLEQALAAGARVYTTELDEHGRLYRISRWFGLLGRERYDGAIERDLGEFYAGLRLRPGPVPGVREVLPPLPLPPPES